MRVVIQRVARASVTIDGTKSGECKQGFLLLLGIAAEDTTKDAEVLAEKIVKLRIFEDDAGKMNRSLLDVGGAVLVISNFTLYADYRKGNRPDFFQAAPPAQANPLYLYFVEQIRNHGIAAETGVFGAEMQVCLCNDGPVTIVMDSEILLKKPGKYENI